MPVPKPPESFALDLDAESEYASPEGTGRSANADPDFACKIKYLFGELDLSKQRLGYLDHGLSSGIFMRNV